MNTWFVIFLIAVVVVAAVLLIYSAFFDDVDIYSMKLKHTRGEYVNDRTAVIVHSIKDTADSAKAYQLLAEYLVTNHSQFLFFIENRIRCIKTAYFDSDLDLIQNNIRKIKEMKVELKDQVETQGICLDSIDSTYHIETSIWFDISNNVRFDICQSLQALSKTCLSYYATFDGPLPKDYEDALTMLVDDVCRICNEISTKIGAEDIDGLKVLGKEIKAIMGDGNRDAMRIHDLLHDGRNTIDPAIKMALRYVLNAMQISLSIIYYLRRLVLCYICILESRRLQPKSEQQHVSTSD